MIEKEIELIAKVPPAINNINLLLANQTIYICQKVKVKN